MGIAPTTLGAGNPHATTTPQEYSYLILLTSIQINHQIYLILTSYQKVYSIVSNYLCECFLQNSNDR